MGYKEIFERATKTCVQTFLASTAMSLSVGLPTSKAAIFVVLSTSFSVAMNSLFSSIGNDISGCERDE